MPNLLAEGMQCYVQTTALTKKLTLNGETKVFPVYRVDLRCLFYNDQNDRIATWISQYKSENGADAFRSLNQEAYNAVVEQFIIQSNPASIEKTQLNIELVNQREPGVVLADGRIIDGNRRYTCLRNLAKKDPKFNWFETVILDPRMENSKKQIKMLELAIQHGEEKKIDYNPIDRLVGIYQDLIKTHLLTVQEYAESTNESEAEVRKRMEHAQLLIEFLEYIHLPEQYHVARDYQVVSVFNDLGLILKKCGTNEMRSRVKQIVFNNVMMRTIGDSRKYIRSLSSMMESGFFKTYMKRQEQIGEQIQAALNEAKPRMQTELNDFVRKNQELAEQLHLSLDKSLLKAKKREIRNRPSQIVSKSISMLKDVDTNIFGVLTEEEREKLKDKIHQLSCMVKMIDTKAAGEDVSEPTPFVNPAAILHKTMPADAADVCKPKYEMAMRRIEEPYAICLDMDQKITDLTFSLRFRLEPILPFQNRTADYQMFFLDENQEIVSNMQSVTLREDEIVMCRFTLNPRISQSDACFLAVRYAGDAENMLLQTVPFAIQLEF